MTHRSPFCQMSRFCSNIWGGHKSRQSKGYRTGFLAAKNSMFFFCFTAETFWLKISFLHKANAMHGKLQPKQLVWQKYKKLGLITGNVCCLYTRQSYQSSILFTQHHPIALPKIFSYLQGQVVSLGSISVILQLMLDRVDYQDSLLTTAFAHFFAA